MSSEAVGDIDCIGASRPSSERLQFRIGTKINYIHECMNVNLCR